MKKHTAIGKFEVAAKELAFITVFLFSVSLVQAATRYSVASGNWNSASIWSATSGGPAGASIPGRRDNVIIERGLNVTVSTSNVRCKTIKIGTPNGTGTLTIGSIANQLTLLGLMTINTNGTFIVSNGTATLTGITSSGKINVSGGMLKNALANITITAGTFTQSGGTIQGTATLPSQSIKFNGGTSIQTGGTMYVRDFIIASGISFTQNENTSTSLIKIAHDYANSGTFNSTSGKVQWTGEVASSTGSNLSGMNNFFNVDFLGSNSLFAGTAGSFNVSGNWTSCNTGTTISAKVTTVTFKGITAQAIGGTVNTTFNNLIINNLSAVVSLANSINMAGALTIKAGSTFNISSYTLGAITKPTGLVMETGTKGSAITGSGTLTLGGDVTVNATSGSSGASISAPVALSAARIFNVSDEGTSATDLTISGVISGNSTNLTKAGAGTMVLSGTNTYTGVTAINNGILSVAVIGNGGAAVNLGQATNLASNIVLGGGTLQYTGATASTDRALTLTAGTTSYIDIKANTLTISGASAHTTGSLTKIGSGTLVLSGANTYTGLTMVTAGTLGYGISNALSSGAVTIDGASATLDIAGFSDVVGTVTLDNFGRITGTTGILSSTGSFELKNGLVSAILGGVGIPLNKTTMATVTLSGANTFTGGVSLKNGVLNINHAQALGTTAGTFTIGGAGNPVTIDNTSGSSVTITPNNPIAWNNDFTFTGSYPLSLGMGSVSMTSNRQVTIAANTLTIGGVISAGSYTLLKAGEGTLSFGSNPVTLNGLNINEGTLVSTAGILNVTGVFSINGTYLHNTGTINFSSSSAQTIPAADYYNLASSNTGNRILASSGFIGIAGIFTPGFNSYNIDGSTIDFNGNGNQTIPSFTYNDLSLSTGGIKSILQTGQVTVDGSLTNNLTADMFVIKSNSSGTGSLLHNTAGVDGTVERYLNNADWSDWKDGWHFLSSPVDEQLISPDFTVAPDATGPYDFYCWYEPKNSWVSYKNTATSPTWSNANTIDNTFPDNAPDYFLVGKGYMAAYDDASTKLFTGHLNVDDVTVSSLAITGNMQGNRSWHLLGNPFACALTWDASPAWNLSNIAGVAKIWNEASQSYSDLTSSPSSVIPATNGFMVQATSGTGSLTLPASKRVHSSQAFFKSDLPGVKLIAHVTGSANGQESTVYFSSDASVGFDAMYDGEFLAGYAPQFYSLAGTDKLSTNTLPEMTSELIIPFGFVKNEFSDFSVELAENLPGSILYLEDKKTNTFHNLTENPIYNFTSDESDNANRFFLHFSGLGFNEPAANETFHINAVNGKISIITEQPVNAEIWVTNIMGQILMRSHTNGNNLTTLNVATLQNGLYVVSLVGNNKKVSEKIIISK